MAPAVCCKRFILAFLAAVPWVMSHVGEHCPAPAPAAPAACGGKVMVAGKCSGNTDAAKDVQCPAGQRYKNNNPNAAGTNANACCEVIQGMCEGNQDKSKDVTCAGANEKNRGSFVAGTDANACCAKTCSAFTCTGNDHVKDTSKNNDIGESNVECCKPKFCCGNEDSALDLTDAKCKALQTGLHVQGTLAMRWTTYTDDASKKTQCCAQDITGQCKGNTKSSEDVACPANKANKGLGFAGTNEAACCVDSCFQHNCPNGEILVPNSDAVPKGADPAATCCMPEVKGMCSGNSDGSAVSCDAGQDHKGQVQGTDKAACCEDRVRKCTNNKDSSQDMTSEVCGHTCWASDAGTWTHDGGKTNTCHAKAAAANAGYANNANDAAKCNACCESTGDHEASSSGAREQGGFSAVLLAAILSLRMF